VQDIYVDAEVHGKTPDEIAASLPHLSLAQIHAALSYYFDHRDEILAEIREDGASIAELMAATGPGPLQAKLKGAASHGDSVSS
jgi:hypothetical protein